MFKIFPAVAALMIILLLGSAGSLTAGEDSDKPPKVNIQILYTGRLMGYFRVPDIQSGIAIDDCGDVPLNAWSVEAQEFDRQRRLAASAILVGTGDNFAPRFEARSFYPQPPSILPTPPNPFRPTGKDQYFWYPKLLAPAVPGETPISADRWVSIDEATRLPNLLDFLKQGWGFIPTDNVGCFFVRENYAAIVPGKHDFYFGPERLRELARFLASTRKPDGRYVQTLGANLVIETSWKNDHKPLPDTEFKLRFAPHWPPKFVPQPSLDGCPQDPLEPVDGLAVPTLLRPADGGKVYPWLAGATLKLMEIGSSELLKQLKDAGLSTDSDLLHFVCSPPATRDPSYVEDLMKLRAIVKRLSRDNTFLCPGSMNPAQVEDPNRIPTPATGGCDGLTQRLFKLEDASVEYFLPFARQAETNFSTLAPGQNYGLCMNGLYLPPIQNAPLGAYYCQRFSVYRPFFSYPSDRTTFPAGLKKPFQDPEPYVYLRADKDNGRPVDIAIFGVVDLSVADYVGTLNLQWENKDKSFKVITAIQDPAEALKEIVEFFNRTAEGKSFNGLKILLTEMSPARAQVLAARVGGFDVVVTGTEPELGSTNDNTNVDWTPTKTSIRQYPAFSAVPVPYYIETRTPKQIVQIGSLKIEAAKELKGTWNFVRGPLVAQSDAQTTSLGFTPATTFWNQVAIALARDCTPRQAPPLLLTTTKHTEQIQLLTLCAMQRQLGADVILLQKRDFFVDLPTTAGDIGAAPDRLQQLLDRIIWKGDFLTLLYVPGSALVQAMEQSKKYKAEDTSAVSLADERQRDLVSLGMRYDPDRDEYLVNEVPLDKSRLYAVATSDYIGAGDTGYSDLVAAAMSPPKVAHDFPTELDTISAIVCRRIASYTPGTVCQPPIRRDEYLDALDMKPVDNRKGQTSARQFYSWSMFDQPHKVPGVSPPQTANKVVDQKIQARGIGSFRINPPDPSLFALDNATLSLSSVNHKFTDGQLRTLFPGSPVPKLTTVRSHSIGFDIRPKYAYSWDHVELFEAQEIRYNVQYTGQANASRIVNQKENLWSTDTGIKFHVKNRALPHMEPVLTFHSETQFLNPLPNFIESIATSGKLALVQPFDQSRTYLLLPRVGLRFADRTSWIEAGLEDGGELNAVRLTTVPAPPPGTGTQTLVQRPNIRVYGAYWNWHTVIPFSSVVSWQIDEDGDFFFNNHDDNPIDTRFRSDAETAVNFKVWPSLSFAPTYEFFLYSNKVQGTWFWQGQASLKMKLRFDFWNHRQWFRRQIEYSPSKTQ